MSDADTVELTESERMANVGVPVETKKLGTIRVRELTLESLLGLSTDIAVLLQAMQDERKTSDDADGLGFLAILATNPNTQEGLRRIASAATSEPMDSFKEMGIGDWLKISVALKEVMDWEELRGLFTQLIPPKTFTALREGFAAATSEPSQS